MKEKYIRYIVLLLAVVSLNSPLLGGAKEESGLTTLLKEAIKYDLSVWRKGGGSVDELEKRYRKVIASYPKNPATIGAYERLSYALTSSVALGRREAPRKYLQKCNQIVKEGFIWYGKLVPEVSKRLPVLFGKHRFPPVFRDGVEGRMLARLATTQSDLGQPVTEDILRAFAQIRTPEVLLLLGTEKRLFGSVAQGGREAKFSQILNAASVYAEGSVMLMFNSRGKERFVSPLEIRRKKGKLLPGLEDQRKALIGSLDLIRDTTIIRLRHFCLFGNEPEARLNASQDLAVHYDEVLGWDYVITHLSGEHQLLALGAVRARLRLLLKPLASVKEIDGLHSSLSVLKPLSKESEAIIKECVILLDKHKRLIAK